MYSSSALRIVYVMKDVRGWCVPLLSLTFIGLCLFEMCIMCEYNVARALLIAVLQPVQLHVRLSVTVLCLVYSGLQLYYVTFLLRSLCYSANTPCLRNTATFKSA